MDKDMKIKDLMKGEDYKHKAQILEYLLCMTERTGRTIKEDRAANLLDYAYAEVDDMLRAIPAADSYREKDQILDCAELLMQLLPHLCAAPTEEKQLKLKALTDMIQRERYLETTLDNIFAQPTIEEADITRLLYWVRQTNDEYHRGKLFPGLDHHKGGWGKLTPAARQKLTDYIANELYRLLSLEPICEDALGVLEWLADVSEYFADKRVIDGLQELLKLGRSNINYYAVNTLYALRQFVPHDVIAALAQDLGYAHLTYHMLRQRGKSQLFPPQYATEEYLAKSDLVHWLSYPTELGKKPDEIQYIGKIKPLFKKQVFHVFKFRSDSDTLGEDQRNKWLIGWSSDQGGTFSKFDEFAPFEQDTTEKTLKLIRKKLIR